MDKELLRTFRNKVNDNDIAYHIFRNQLGKNRWSIICSAMDWIDVSLDGIDCSKLSKKNDNHASINMMTFVTCISVMWEAVQQLHRVLFDTKKIPLEDDFTIFNQYVCDNRYFKTIRACFAAHQINLSEVYPDDDVDERWFASWSGGTFSRKDFSVVLYSNKVNKEPRFFDISFSAIYLFAEKRYNHLAVLIERVDKIVNNHIASFKDVTIKRGVNVIDTVEILLEENQKRFDNEYFDYELKKIKRVFEIYPEVSEDNSDVVSKYKGALAVELQEICAKLQNMELGELSCSVNDDIPMNISYAFSKLSDAVWQDKPCPIFEHCVKELQNFFADLINIDISMSQDEVYVLVCAGAFMMNSETLNRW